MFANINLLALLFLFLIFIAIFIITYYYFVSVNFISYKDGGNSKTKQKQNKIKDLAAHPRSKSEAAVIRIAEQLIGCPMPTVNPHWLTYEGKTLELDGYCESKRIALEFSGPLHTKWYPRKETYKQYHTRVIKDQIKIQKCKENNVCLIVIDMRLPVQHWRPYIQSRLHDFDPSTYFMPANYINEQNVEPYRNPELEKEL